MKRDWLTVLRLRPGQMDLYTETLIHFIRSVFVCLAED